MPWSATKEGTLDSLKNKSLEIRKLFAEVANKALEDGKDEQTAIRYGLAAVSKLEHSKRQVAKSQLEQQKLEAKLKEESYVPPLHLSALIKAKELKVQQELEKQQQEELKIKEQINKLASDSLVLPEIEEMHFDTYGKLVMTFSNGKKIKSSNAVPEEVINQYIAVNAPLQTQKSLEPMTMLNAQGEPEIVFYSDGSIVSSIVDIEE